jgi:hypothetical protein
VLDVATHNWVSQPRLQMHWTGLHA